MVAIILSGCSSTPTISRIGRDNWNRYFDSSYNKNSLNQNSQNFLADYILTQDYEDNNIDIIVKAQAFAKKDATNQNVLNLADIAYQMGLKNYDDEKLAIQFFVYSAIASYGFLAERWQTQTNLDDTSTIQYRQSHAMDIYNLSINEIFTYIQKNQLWDKPFSVNLFTGQTIKFLVPKFKIKVAKEIIKNVYLSANYEALNFNHISRVRGIGTPIILQFKPKQLSKITHVRFADAQASPATYLIQFKPINKNTYSAEPVIFDSLKYHNITVGKNSIDLDQDLTMPLAFMMQVPLKYNFVYYMLFPMKSRDVQGLYMFEPMDVNKIPVVFVHGLLSNSRTWLQMVNTLRNDKKIRDTYQFWGYSYSSGNPIILSAKEFNKELKHVRETLSKNGYNMKKFDQMILVGHSMGGLLCKTTALDNEDEILKKLLLQKENKEMYEKLPKGEQKVLDYFMDFRSLDFIKKVVFIATPHRGASLANDWIGLIGSALIELPQSILLQGIGIGTVFRENGYYLPKTMKLKTGIQNLSPQDHFLQTLNKIPLSKDKKYHSIIGDIDDATKRDGSDGVVDYNSSHIDHVDSEVVVKSNHSVHKNPLAIQELKRILLLNVK